MNLKLLIFGVFTAWIVLCTKWYVCEIQQSCYEDSRFEKVANTIDAPVSQPLAIASEPAPRAPEKPVQNKVEKKPEVVKTASKSVNKDNNSDKPKKKPVKVAAKQRSALAAEPVAESSGLTAKGGTRLVSGPKTVTGKSTRKVSVEKGKNRLTICFPQQYTEKLLRTATDEDLSELARQWKKSGGKITVTGHTDFVGSAEANYEVGMERALNVRDILKSKGVPASKITCTSEGEDMPRASNDTPYGRFQNRRVEVVIKK